MARVRPTPHGRCSLLVIAALAGSLAAQSTCRDYIRIQTGTLTYTFQGTGTHRYATGAGVADAPKSGAFEHGIYTCWHPTGWKNVEVRFDRGVRFTTYDAGGKAVLELRSEGLQSAWHPNGRVAFVAEGGGFQFWNADGSIAADVRLCQDIWSAWSTDVEVDEWHVWSGLLQDQYVGTIVPALVAGLDHAGPWVRAYACEAIDTFDERAAAAVPALRRAVCDDPFWLVRQRAAEALCNLGPLAKEAVPELVQVLGDAGEDAATRALAARALGDIGAPAAAAVPALEAAARAGPPGVQVEAVGALGWIDPADRQTVQQLAGRLGDREAALAAARVLFVRYRAVAGAARDAVQRELEQQGEQMTELAMQLAVLLHHIDRSAPQPRWAEGLVDSTLPLPRRALAPAALLAFCMLDADPDEIVDAISTLASCDDKYLREALLELTTTLGPEARAAVPGLVHLLGTIDSATGDWASRALRHIGPPAIPALAAALRPKDRPWGASLVIETLAAIGEPATLALVGALGNDDPDNPWLRIGAATALGRIGPAASAAVPALRQVLSAPNEELRAAAAVALARIEGPARRSPRAEAR